MCTLAAKTINERLPARAIDRTLKGHACSELHTPRQGRRGGAGESQTLDHRRIRMKQVADRPFAKNIMTERDAVVSQVGQCLTRDQGIDCLCWVITDV